MKKKTVRVVNSTKVKKSKKVEPMAEKPVAAAPETPVVPKEKRTMYANKEVIKVEDIETEHGPEKRVYLSDGSIEVVELRDFELRISKEE